MIVNARKFGMVKNIGITIKEMDNIIGRREIRFCSSNNIPLVIHKNLDLRGV